MVMKRCLEAVGEFWDPGSSRASQPESCDRRRGRCLAPRLSGEATAAQLLSIRGAHLSAGAPRRL